jgi:hypothetical protein
VSKNSAVRAEKDGSGSSFPLWPGSIEVEPPPAGPGRLNEEPLRTSMPIGSRSSSSDTVDQAAHICQMMHELTRPEQPAVLHEFHQQPADTANSDRVTGPARLWIVGFLALCCLILIPWTIGIALTLPRHYVVGNWPLAWTGFDLILLGCLSTTAWALWKRRQVAVPAAMITSALLLCDAWFDILTAHPGRCMILSIATAMFAELPVAILLGLTSIELLRLNMNIGQPGEPGSKLQTLWRARLPERTSGPDPTLTARTRSKARDRETLVSSAT